MTSQNWEPLRPDAGGGTANEGERGTLRASPLRGVRQALSAQAERAQEAFERHRLEVEDHISLAVRRRRASWMSSVCLDQCKRFMRGGNFTGPKEESQWALRRFGYERERRLAKLALERTESHDPISPLRQLEDRLERHHEQREGLRMCREDQRSEAWRRQLRMDWEIHRWEAQRSAVVVPDAFTLLTWSAPCGEIAPKRHTNFSEWVQRMKLRVCWGLGMLWPLGDVQAVGMAAILVRPGVPESRCQVPSELTESEMRLVYQWNCDKVQKLSRDWRAAELTVSEEQKMIWFHRNTTAQMLCAAARRNLLNNDGSTAAALAIEAWGQHMMNGTACCPLPHAPFCLDAPTSFARCSLRSGGYFSFVICLFGWVLMP
eukprot:Skav231993  [mRNA]  locus=scaffold719:384949:391784:- [translate_table: standard]